MKILFATSNPNKIIEAKKILKDFNLTGLKEVGITEEIPENEPTIKGNALAKMRYVYKKTGINCFADDTGLEVEALNGAPGVYSARYAGLDCNFENNMNKLLSELKDKENRKARFVTVVALNIDGEEYCFEGTVQGIITTEKQGLEGFGYDPIFKPDGFECSFAEMSLQEKNKISHRGKAMAQLAEFLNKRF